MYTHHFGLREKPFQIAPSPKFLYPSETHDESRARILYGIEDSRGFVVVYGKVGLGKTTVLLSVLEELDSTTRSALLYQPVRNFLDLLRMVAHEFGLPSEGRDEVNLIWDLNEFFIQRLAEEEKCVLIVDEAQNLSLDILEKLRTLSNLQTEDASLLQIVLVGQPELYEKLMDPRLLQLRQRVGVWHEIESLDAEETTDYILHRLQKAGARRPKDIIDKKLCRQIHDYTQGVPRVINQVCDTALMIAYGREESRMSQADLLESARELHLDTADELVDSSKSAARRSNSSPTFPWRRTALAAAVILVVVGALWVLQNPSIKDIFTGGDGGGQGVATDVLAGEIESPPTRLPADEPEMVAVESAPEADAADLTPVQSGAATDSANPADLRYQENCIRMRRRLSEVEGWRSEGRSVYTVHLHSFQKMQRARDFADGLCRGHEWDQPLFVEERGTDPIWFRVMAGGFQNPRAARSWIAEWKQKQGTGYAQATRLDRRAQVLLPRELEDEFAQQGVDG